MKMKTRSITNESSPPKQLGLFSLMEPNDHPSRDPSLRLEISEPPQPDVNDKQTDLPAQNETTGTALPVINASIRG